MIGDNAERRLRSCSSRHSLPVGGLARAGVATLWSHLRHHSYLSRRSHNRTAADHTAAGHTAAGHTADDHTAAGHTSHCCFCVHSCSFGNCLAVGIRGCWCFDSQSQSSNPALVPALAHTATQPGHEPQNRRHKHIVLAPALCTSFSPSPHFASAFWY